MRLLLSVGLGAGLTLLWSGLAGGDSLWTRRVEPYLNGLGGRSAPAHRGGALLGPVIGVVARLIPSGGAALRARLAAAGWALSIDGFRYTQAAWALTGAIVGAAGGGWSLGLRGGHGGMVPAVAILGGLIGYLSRDVVLTRAVSDRRRRIADDLPLALDLLTLSIMAGETIPAAFGRVAAALQGDVGEGFRDCVADIRAGTPTLDALERLPQNLPGSAMARLVDSLCTGIERGAPLADTLRAQCDDLRDARRRELMESGGRREILMLVPVVFLILPVVVAFALYPGLVALDLLVA